MLNHHEINIIKDDWPLHVRKTTNALDFDEFRQIILYFSLSTWTHIAYRIKIKVVRWHILFFCFFLIHNMYTFRHKKKTFYRTLFLFNLKDVHLWLICLARNHNTTVDYFFHQLVLYNLCKPIVQWHPSNAQPTNISLLVFCKQPKDLISENMKISK